MCLSESGALARSGNFRDLGTEIGEANVKNLWNFWNPRYHLLFASYPQFLRQPGVIREQNLGIRGQRQGAVRSVSQGTLVRKLCSWESGEGETNTTATWNTDRENGKSGQGTLRYSTGHKDQICGGPRQNLEETETLLTKQRRARAIMECVEKVESKKEALESAFEDLITHIHDMDSTSFQPPTDPYEMAQSVELTISQRSGETKEKLETHDDAIKKAERILAKKLTLKTVLPGPPVQVERQAPAIPIFRAQSDLKPSQLEASSSYMECKHFCEVFSSYLAAGYGGEDKIPQEMICIQLQPFVSAEWWAMMLEDDVKTKNLGGVRQTIMKVANVHTATFSAV